MPKLTFSELLECESSSLPSSDVWKREQAIDRVHVEVVDIALVTGVHLSACSCLGWREDDAQASMPQVLDGSQIVLSIWMIQHVTQDKLVHVALGVSEG